MREKAFQVEIRVAEEKQEYPEGAQEGREGQESMVTGSREV